MYKYILLILTIYTYSYSQEYDNIISQILANNKDIKAYEQYLNGISLESKFNLLPPNPQINYGLMSASATGRALNNSDRQDLIVLQPFEFPTAYFIKSDISSNQFLVNKYRLLEHKKKIVLLANNLLTNYLFQNKIISRYELRLANYDSILKSMEIKFNNAEISILELNKTKTSLALIKSKLNLAVIELEYLKSAIINLNGGQFIELNINELPVINVALNRDSTINVLQNLDFNNQLYNNEKELYQNKIRLSKSGWLPNFSLGYRYEREPGFEFNGAQFNLSIPIFENRNKVPKAESDLMFIELKQQAYNAEFKNNKKRLFDRFRLLESFVREQKDVLDDNQFDLLLKSFNLGQISLTEFYYGNTIYYDLEDLILLNQKELHLCYNELMIELTLSRFE